MYNNLQLKGLSRSISGLLQQYDGILSASRCFITTNINILLKLKFPDTQKNVIFLWESSTKNIYPNVSVTNLHFVVCIS